MEEEYSETKEKVRLLKLPYRLPKHLTEILDGFKLAVRTKNQSIVMVVDGRSGLGKTTLSGQCGLYCDPDFSLKKVCFTPDDFLETLSKAKKGDFICFDEAMLISSRAAMSSINRAIVIAMSMIRSKNIFVCFNINSIFDLDRNLALHRCDLLLHVYSEGLTDRGRFMAFFRSLDGRDRIKELYLHGKKLYSYASPKSNFNTTFGKYFVVDEEGYEIKKQEGVNSFLKKSSPYGNKDKQQRDKLILWIRENTKLTLEEIGKIAGITDRTILNVLRRNEK